MLERIIEKATSAFRKPDPQLAPRPKLLSLTEWSESEAHLAFLAHFLEGRSAASYLDNWVSALDEAPREVIARFIRQGLLEPLPLIDNVAGCNTVAELKKLLKERGLKVAGKKSELAERLVLNDEAGMDRLHRDKAIVTCSARIRALTSQYLAEKAKDHDDTIAAALIAMRSRNFALVSQTIAAYRDRQLKLRAPNPLTIEGPSRSTAADIAELQIVVGLRPKLFGDLSASDWHAIHAVAGVDNLIGGSLSADWLPSDFVGPSKFDRETVLRMMRFAFLHHRDLQRLRELNVKQATFVCVNAGSCEACLKMTDKLFPLAKFPELPYERCTCEMGCRCGMQAVIPGFD